MARTGRPRKGVGLRENVKTTMDPNLRRGLEENEIEVAEALDFGARMLLEPEFLEVRRVHHTRLADVAGELKQRRLEEIREEELLASAEPLIKEFLSTYRRQLGDDFWKKGSPHFDRFQTKLGEWAAQPEIQVKLREASVPAELVEPLVVLHLSR